MTEAQVTVVVAEAQEAFIFARAKTPAVHEVIEELWNLQQATRIADTIFRPAARIFRSTCAFSIESIVAVVRDRLKVFAIACACLLYTSDAADDLLCVDLGGRRIIKKKM